MLICFHNPATEAVFNERARLERRYGRLVAERVGMRMQVLLAAENLALVPTTPPIFLRIDPQPDQFSVALAESKRLRFRATEGCTYNDGQIDLETVMKVEVLGVYED